MSCKTSLGVAPAKRLKHTKLFKEKSLQKDQETLKTNYITRSINFKKFKDN